MQYIYSSILLLIFFLKRKACSRHLASFSKKIEHSSEIIHLRAFKYDFSSAIRYMRGSRVGLSKCFLRILAKSKEDKRVDVFSSERYAIIDYLRRCSSAF